MKSWKFNLTLFALLDPDESCHKIWKNFGNWMKYYNL